MLLVVKIKSFNGIEEFVADSDKNYVSHNREEKEIDAKQFIYNSLLILKYCPKNLSNSLIMDSTQYLIKVKSDNKSLVFNWNNRLPDNINEFDALLEAVRHG